MKDFDFFVNLEKTISEIYAVIAPCADLDGVTIEVDDKDLSLEDLEVFADQIKNFGLVENFCKHFDKTTIKVFMYGRLHLAGKKRFEENGIVYSFEFDWFSDMPGEQETRCYIIEQCLHCKHWTRKHKGSVVILPMYHIADYKSKEEDVVGKGGYGYWVPVFVTCADEKWEIGDRVIYYSHLFDDKGERGTITGGNSEFVFVLYDKDKQAKATPLSKAIKVNKRDIPRVKRKQDRWGRTNALYRMVELDESKVAELFGCPFALRDDLRIHTVRPIGARNARIQTERKILCHLISKRAASSYNHCQMYDPKPDCPDYGSIAYFNKYDTLKNSKPVRIIVRGTIDNWTEEIIPR